MFDWRKEKPKPVTTEIRETLFGDMPLSQWASFSTQTTSEPWASFERARHFIESRDTQSATAALQGILEIPGLESRHYLQAYHFLAELGVTPIRELSKNVLGVVVEVGMKVGPDLVAGYADHHARYYNYSGAGIVWERPDGTLDTTIDELLRVGSAVAQVIGPWKETRSPAPTIGRARLNLLTPSGLHFGEGPLDTLAKDKLGGPVINSAFRLTPKARIRGSLAPAEPRGDDLDEKPEKPLQIVPTQGTGVECFLPRDSRMEIPV